MKILLIDNYDSFTYNLEQLIGNQYSGELVVKRNDEIEAHELLGEYEALVISPGPGRPADVPITCEMIRQNIGKIPILGICLGMQCINEVFGGKIIRADYPIHGKTSPIIHNKAGIFTGILQNCTVARYHSLIVQPAADLETTAWLEDGTVMAQQHPAYPIWAVQFHPESFLTQQGDTMVANFLKLIEDFYA